jgi:hypothetical protein
MNQTLQTCERIEEPNLDNTEKLLEQILLPLIKHDSRVRFLCPANEGKAIAQRLRVMLSRKRKTLEARGKKPRRFRLHSEIYRETHHGIRYDCVVLWQSVNDVHMMTQDLEDLISNG